MVKRDVVDWMVSTWKCPTCGRTYIGAHTDAMLILAGNESPNPVRTAPTFSEAVVVLGACLCGSDIHVASRFAAFVANEKLVRLDGWPADARAARLN